MKIKRSTVVRLDYTPYIFADAEEGIAFAETAMEHRDKDNIDILISVKLEEEEEEEGGEEDEV